MDDIAAEESGSETSILQRIHELIDAEKRLRLGSHGLPGTGRRQLEMIERQLDQAWDLLRQRRARKESGESPELTAERSTDEVESYLQ